MIRCAKPSAIAVLPTPGSPTSMGLFLERLDKICSVLLISSSRPITGSSLPLRAISFKFFAYLFNALYCVSDVWEEIVEPLRRSVIAAVNPFSLRPASFKILAALSLPCKIANNKCSTLTNSSLKVFRIDPAFSITLFKSLPKVCAGSVPLTFGSFCIASSTLLSTKFTFTLFFLRRNSIGVSSSLNKAFNKCSVSMLGF